MKKRNFDRKLVLKKSTISDLSSKDMNNARGGELFTKRGPICRDTFTCPPTFNTHCL